MKTISKLGFTMFLVAAVFFSCKRAENPNEEAPSEISKQTTSVLSSSAVVEKKESDRKFIRTADIKFKVKNVTQSTYAIENIVTKFDGFITHTHLQSTVIEKLKTKISPDSTLETIKYNVENKIIIRVPNARLDTVVKSIALQIDFLDYRIIKADDVSLQLKGNKMAEKRGIDHEKRLEKAIDTKGKKLDSVVEAEENLASKKEQTDGKIIENLSLQDQVAFSTLTLEIYQDETVKQELKANTMSSDTYRPHLGLLLLDGLKTGWYMIVNSIVFATQLWALLLIGLLGFLLYKRYLKK